MDYVLHLLVFVLIYAMVGFSLNVTSGFTRLISLAHAGFFGIGAYSAAILSTNLGWSMWLNVPVAMFVAFIVAFPEPLLPVRQVTAPA